ncbi:MAG TPA: hypothetical protein VFW22_18930 [Pseudolabrys sp.]|nr:hypothetical protein [Pseudolabrys sp.]
MIQLLLSILYLIAALLAAPQPAQAQSADACLRLAHEPLNRDNEAALRQQLDSWVETCRQASATNPADTRLKIGLSKALWHAQGRPASLPPLREAIAQGDTNAMLELFNDYNSFDGHLDRPDLIPREEAVRALRRAAELGNTDAIWRLATISSRGGPLKHDMAEARKWGAIALTHPPKNANVDVGTLKVVVGHWLSLSDDAAERARGIALLEALPQRGDAQAYLAEAIRGNDPVRARALLEASLRSYPGHALAPLCDMLIKGEGGPKDEKRAVALLQKAPYDAQHPKALLGELMLEGRLVPRDAAAAIKLMGPWSQWDYDTRLKLLHAVTANPTVTLSYPEHYLTTVMADAEVGEPGAMEALIALKLSNHVQFADKAGGCAAAERAVKAGHAAAAPYLASCGAK